MYNENNHDYMVSEPYLFSGLVHVHICLVVGQV